MLNNSKINRSKNGRRKWFILLPAVFLLCGYLLLSVCLSPILDPLVSVYQLVFTNANAQTIAKPEVSDTFNGSTGLMHGALKFSDISFPKYGETFGHITVDGTDISAPLIYGDEKQLLKKGACMSLYSRIPGAGKGTMISAHNNTYFHTLQEVEMGTLVHIETTWGIYVYKVYNTKILNKDDAAGYQTELNGDKNTLILYTCYPNNTIASTQDRFFVFCEYISGPSVDMYS